jgi:hypothetical protein
LNPNTSFARLITAISIYPNCGESHPHTFPSFDVAIISAWSTIIWMMQLTSISVHPQVQASA